MLAEIASSVPIPPNIDIVVRLLLLLVTSKNEIKNPLRPTRTSINIQYQYKAVLILILNSNSVLKRY